MNSRQALSELLSPCRGGGTQTSMYTPPTPVSSRQPGWAPGPGREHYLPEDAHFVDQARVPFNLAARVTARCVAQWADRYQAYPLSGTGAAPSPASARWREGALPTDPGGREALIDDLFDWLERQRVLLQAAVNLYHDEQPVLEQHEGIPGVLALTRDEFVQLQDTWEHHGLPRDLYYPLRDQRTVIEPVGRHGGIVRSYEHYSPLGWAQRDPTARAALHVPSEETRADAFFAARKQFMEALLRRGTELPQPAKRPHREQAQP